MKTTKVGDISDLQSFATTFLKMDESTARMKVEDEFFPECDRFVHFHVDDFKDRVVKRSDYKSKDDYEDDRDEMAELIVAFLKKNKTEECYLIGPDY